MNTERMMMLADLLDSLPEEKFNIAYWVSHVDSSDMNEPEDYVDLSVYNCNSAACIAGWAVALKNDLNAGSVYCGDIEKDAAEYLELTPQEKSRLFYYGSDTIWGDYYDVLGCEQPFEHSVTNKMAATAVRNIAQGKWELV